MSDSNYKRRVRKTKNRTSRFDFCSSAKTTYNDLLISTLTQPMYKTFKKICDNVQEKHKSQTKVLTAFQTEMANIKKLKQPAISSYITYTLRKAKTTTVVMQKMINAAIISSFKMYQVTGARKQKQTEIPHVDMVMFFRQCYIEIGKDFYVEPFIICNYNKADGYRLRDIKEALFIIELAIKRVLNSYLPLDSLLDVYINNIDEDSDSDYEFIYEKKGASVDDEGDESASDIEDMSADEDESYAGAISEEETDVEDTDDEDPEADREIPAAYGNDDEESADEESMDGSVDSADDSADESADEDAIKENDFEEDEELSISEDIPEELNIVPLTTDKLEEEVNPSEQSDVPSPPKPKKGDDIKAVKVERNSKNSKYFEDADELN